MGIDLVKFGLPAELNSVSLPSAPKTVPGTVRGRGKLLNIEFKAHCKCIHVIYMVVIPLRYAALFVGRDLVLEVRRTLPWLDNEAESSETFSLTLCWCLVAFPGLASVVQSWLTILDSFECVYQIKRRRGCEESSITKKSWTQSRAIAQTVYYG